MAKGGFFSGAIGEPGTNGTNGTDGSTWRDGSGAPSNGLGINGDYYLNTTNWDLYKKDTGVYLLIGNIKGQDAVTITKTLVSNVSLLAANFTLVSGYYEYNYANVLITTQSLVTIVPLNSTIAIVSAAVFLPNITTSAGNAKLYSTNLPSGNMDVDVWILT